jgi:hypothetical protein
MNDEALKLALEALELNNNEWKSLADSGDCGYWNAKDQDHYKQTNEAITAIKQALAAQQPDVDAMIALARADEREACAKVCDDAFSSIHAGRVVCDNLAYAIRARGTHDPM